MAVELLTIFFHCGDSLAIKIAIVILEVCGKKLSQIHEDTLNVVFDRVCKLLNNEELYEEVNNIVFMLFISSEYIYLFLPFSCYSYLGLKICYKNDCWYL